jgi:hypothetical protein
VDVSNVSDACFYIELCVCGASFDVSGDSAIVT